MTWKFASRGIAWFQFNSPERLNGLTTAIKRDLIEAVTQAQMDNSVRVLVFTGTGRAFCAGDDLRAYRGADLGGKPLVDSIPAGHDNELGTYNGLRTISQALNTAVRNLDKLTVCALNGIAIQTGFSLALSCDFRIAADTARVGSATLRFGLLPDEGGQYLLVQAMGIAKTMGIPHAQENRRRNRSAGTRAGARSCACRRTGIRSDGLGRRIGQRPAGIDAPAEALGFTTQRELSWSQSLDEIAAKTAISDHHPDAREGVAAFNEKRDATFNTWLDAKA